MEIQQKNLLILASGTATGGGSGANVLCEQFGKGGYKDIKIVGLVSNHENGGVRQIAERHGIPFYYFPAPWSAERYQELVKKTEADFVACSGWLKLTVGLDPRTTFNIHPAPLPKFGGKGMYGIHAHEAVIDAFNRGEIKESAVTMHFVDEVFDRGPKIWELPVEIIKGDTAKSLAARVNKAEHEWQYIITARIIRGEVTWDGRDPASLVWKEAA